MTIPSVVDEVMIAPVEVVRVDELGLGLASVEEVSAV